MNQKQKVMTNKGTINGAIKVMLAMFGIWPRTSYIMIIRAYWIITSISDQIWICRYFYTHWQSRDFSNFVDSFSSFLAYIKITGKVLIFWWNQRRFAEILKIMAQDWNDCTSSADDMRKTVWKAKLSNRIINAMFVLHMTTAMTFSVGVFLANVDVTDHESELPMIFKIQMPIKIKTQRAYKLFLTTQFVQLLMIACGTGLINALLLTLILHLGGQLDILRSWLCKLVSQDNNKVNESTVVVMSKIIRKHQKIITFAKCIEDLYTYIALVVFTTNITLICLLGFLIVTAINGPNATENIAKWILFYIVTSLETFIFCYAGEYLKNKSKAVGNAAYNSAWYKLRYEESRVLMLVIVRAQKHLMLTVGKIMELSLESFTDIMKMSGSYMSMLLAMQ